MDFLILHTRAGRVNTRRLLNIFVASIIGEKHFISSQRGMLADLCDPIEGTKHMQLTLSTGVRSRMATNENLTMPWYADIKMSNPLF